MKSLQLAGSALLGKSEAFFAAVNHDCLGDRSSADNLSEIVDPICNTVMATGPDAQVDRYPIAPENRMRIYVRRACIAHNIACIVHSSSRGREKSGRNWQLPDPGRVTGVRYVIFPNDRKDIAPTRNEAGIIDSRVRAVNSAGWGGKRFLSVLDSVSL